MAVIRRQAPSYLDTPLSLISQGQHSPSKFKRMQVLLERSLRVSPGIAPTHCSPSGLEFMCVYLEGHRYIFDILRNKDVVNSYGTYGTAAPPFTRLLPFRIQI